MGNGYGQSHDINNACSSTSLTAVTIDTRTSGESLLDAAKSVVGGESAITNEFTIRGLDRFTESMEDALSIGSGDFNIDL